MRKVLKYAAMGFCSLLIAIQFIRPPKTNPPVTAPLQAPADVDAILRKACFDCHSYQTKWPWYSKVAPASWLVVHDVNEGREYLNFSTWENMTEEDKVHLLREIAEEVEEGHMPPKKYTVLHGEAKLSDAERTQLLEWAASRPQ